jgi:crotonobetainyl-CoA:carnitine CoA-transferase CaiB-like acyl-CoA transferase
LTGKPLDGLRVFDTTCYWGEFAGRLLAELGAETLRLDFAPPPPPPREGDEGDDTYLFHVYRSLGKRPVDPGGGDGRLEELLSWADIWLDSARAGSPSRPTLDPHEVLGRHPHLVITSITPFGHTGPYSLWEATDGVLDATSGMMFKAGVPHKPPLMPPSSLSNDVGSTTAVLATLAAYWQKLRTGHGQHIDLSLMDAAAQATDWSLPMASALMAAGFPVPQVRSGPGPFGIYRCLDGFIRLVLVSAAEWRAMRAWLGEPEYLQDSDLGMLAVRAQMAPVLDPLYSELFAGLTRLEATNQAQQRGIAVTPVLAVGEVLTNPHVQARGVFREYKLESGQVAGVFSGPVEVDGVRQSPPAGVEPLGEEEHLPPRVDPVTAVPAPARPLEGVRVVDFGIGGVGVEGGRLLAELGADVVKIETRTYPDFIRIIAGGEMNASFASSSRTKRSFGVNLKKPDGLALCHRLMSSADVVIENLSAGAMDSMQVGYATACERNPRLVMVSSQLLGSSGPWSTWTGYGPSTQPVAGLLSVWDYDDDDPPAGNTTILPDHLAGRVVALGAVAGLIGRERTGSGCHVEVAQAEVTMAVIGDQLLREALHPGSARAQGNCRDAGTPWGAYPCAGEQQWCVITVRDDSDWKQLTAALDHPAWAMTADLASAAGRRAARDDLDRHLAAWTSGLAKSEIADRLQRFGVPCAPVLTAVDQLQDPHLLAHGYPVPVEQQDLGPVTFEGPCYTATGMPGPLITQAPRLGEHTREICRDDLQMTDDEFDRLVDLGALEIWRPPPAV